MTDTAPDSPAPDATVEPAPAPWQGRVATLYLALLGALLFLGHPLALIPARVDPDLPATRITVIVVFVLLGLGAAVIWRWPWRRRLLLSLPCWILAALVAVLPPNLAAHKVSFTVPITLIAMTAELPLLVALGWRLHRGLLAAALGLVGLSLIHAIIAPDWLTEAAVLATYALVPLAVAVAARYSPVGPRGMAAVATLLWLLVLSYAVIERLHSTLNPRTITGNPNWTAATALALCPWVAWLVYRGALRWGRPAGIAVAAIVALLPTLVLVVDCDTRAGYVVLVAVPAWLLLCRVAPLALRVGLVVVAAIAVVCVVLWPPARLAEATVADVRLPLWQGTLHIVGEHPAGVGPGRMATYGPPAVAQTGFYQRPVISNTTDHPHNEALHVAVQLGLPGLLCWVGLLSVLLGDPLARHRPVVERLGLLTAQCLALMAMFDVAWLREPSSLLGLLGLGLVLRGWLRRRGPWAAWQHVAGRLPLLSVTGVLVIAVGYLCVRETAASWLRWQAINFNDYATYLFANERDGYPAIEASVVHFERAIAWKPNFAEAELDLARLQAGYLGDWAAARDTLEALHARNPNFSILNRRLGQVYMALGDHDAGVAAFTRNAELFPERPQSWQRLLNAQHTAGDLAGLVETDRRLQAAIWAKRLSHPGEAQTRAIMERWPASIEAGSLDVTESLQARGVASDFIDGNAPEDAYERSDWTYDGDDLGYFRLLLRRDAYLRELDLAGETRAEQAATIIAATRALVNTDQAAAELSAPQSWAVAEARDHGILELEAWLLEGIGVDTLLFRVATIDDLQCGNTRHPYDHAVAVIDGAIYMWAAPTAEWLDGDDLGFRRVTADQVPASVADGYLAVDFAAFAMRNQAIMVYAAHSLEERPYLRATRTPQARSAELVQALAALGVAIPYGRFDTPLSTVFSDHEH